MKRKIQNKNLGFTLIEIMVSVSIFAIILLVTSGSIFTVFDANRKSQNLRSVMDNLNYSLESMTRTIRFGNTYHCDRTQGITTQPRDCAAGATSMVLYDVTGIEVIYDLNGGVIKRIINSVSNDMTSSDITITNLKFFVLGSTPLVCSPICASPHDVFQPRVIILVDGYVGTKASSKSTFSLQTTVSQRKVDAQ